MSTRRGVPSHTEYARERFQCPRCGERVPVRHRGPAGLCVACRDE